MCTRCNYVWLAADEPDEGEREAVQAVADWSSTGFHRQHYSAMLAQVQTALYRDDGDRAWRLLAEHQPGLRRSMLLHVQALRIETRYLRARSALAIAAATPTQRRRFLSIARAEAARIARERMPWSDPIARLVCAGIASVVAQADEAVRQLRDAADGFERADTKLYLAVARRRLGRLWDDPSSSQLGRLGDDWMSLQGIKNPTALTRMLAPGFPD